MGQFHTVRVQIALQTIQNAILFAQGYIWEGRCNLSATAKVFLILPYRPDLCEAISLGAPFIWKMDGKAMACEKV